MPKQTLIIIKKSAILYTNIYIQGYTSADYDSEPVPVPVPDVEPELEIYILHF